MALDCTLLSDGSSDRALIPILAWLFGQQDVRPLPRIVRYEPGLYRAAGRSLEEKILHAIDVLPCDLLFVHRDSEAQEPETRVGEIQSALENLRKRGVQAPPRIMVIPVRMSEAWLLFNEGAIRRAAGCPRGTTRLDLPRLRDCEQLADPKEKLHALLRLATEKQGRHLKKFNVDAAVHRLAELIEDYSPLRQLPAFQRLECGLRNVLGETFWH